MNFPAWPHPTFVRLLPRWRPYSIAARLFAITLLTLATITTLVGMTVHLAWWTQTDATILFANTADVLMDVGDLSDTVERLRLVVRAMPSLSDPDRIAAQDGWVNDEMRALATMGRESTLPSARQMEQDLPAMAASAERVFRLTIAGLHGLEVDTAEGAFTAAATKVRGDIVALRQSQLARLRAGIVTSNARVTTRVRWIAAVTLMMAALALLKGAVEYRALRRLTRVTAAMLRLARRETDLVIPALGDPDEIGRMAAAVAVFQTTARQLDQANRELDAALNNMSNGVAMVGPDGRLLVANRRAVELFGCRAGDVRPGMSLADIAAVGITHGCYLEAGVERLTTMLQHYLSNRTAVVQTLSLPQCGERSARILCVRRQPMDDGGMVCTYEDITEREQALARIDHMARHDPLTGLANRRSLGEEIERALRRARRGEDFAVLALDLDRFKQVNDTLGHPAGDALLEAVAQRLRETVREVDTVARIGGDEFAVVQAGVAQPMHAKALAARLLEAMAAPYSIDGYQAIVSISIGVALSGPDAGANSAELLLRRADLALYQAKHAGGGTWRFFAPEMEESAKVRLTMETELRAGLDEAQFELQYQPMINAQGWRVNGFEALPCWHHPTRGLLPSAEFLPFATETGLAVPIGEWVLKTACKEAAGWQTGQPDDKRVRVAVKVSAVQFGSPGFVESVRRALDESGLTAQRLELEVTEDMVLRQGERTLSMLHRLRAMGVRISMDDFGGGGSSLSYLCCFPFDKIKIDLSFMLSRAGSGESNAIVRAVAALGTGLRVTTLAEGVESEAQLEQLVANGCDEVQGFFFSPPVPGDQVPDLLAEAQAGWPRRRGLPASGHGGGPSLTTDTASPVSQRLATTRRVATEAEPELADHDHGLVTGGPT